MHKTLVLPITETKGKVAFVKMALTLAISHQSRLVLLRDEQLDDIANLPFSFQITLAKIKQAGLLCEVFNRDKKLLQAICDTANKFDADLIVISSSWLDLKMNRRSSNARLIQLASCPVLVVP